MRLYDFECNQCGKRFEDLVRELSEARCPACSSADVTKQLSAFKVGSSSKSDAGPMPPMGCGGGMCGGGNGGGGCPFSN